MEQHRPPARSIDRVAGDRDADAARRVDADLVGAAGLWREQDDRPPIPMAKVVPQGENYAGESGASKRHRLGDALSAEQVDAVVITSPASIAWLFNVRGGDVARTPLPLGEALLRADGTADLFLADAKVSPELKQWLGNEVAVKPTEALQPTLASLSGKRVKLDPGTASAWYFEQLKAAYHHLEANDANIVGVTHHGHTKSVYVKDPDGLEIELFCDVEHDPNGTEAQVRAELEA